MHGDVIFKRIAQRSPRYQNRPSDTMKLGEIYFA